MLNLLITALSGTIAGIVNGFIGTGGGIILVLILSKSIETKDTFATVIAAVLPMSLVSAISYAVQGNVPFKETAVYILPAIIGGIIGAVLLDKIGVRWLKVIFSVLVVYSGIRMIVT
jgi:Sulfite exporter TauE/SafE.